MPSALGGAALLWGACAPFLPEELVLGWEGEAQAVDLSPDGTVAFAMDKGEAIAIGPEGEELRTVCGSQDCAVLLEGEELSRTTEGSAVAWNGDVPCWADAAWAVE